MPEPVVIVLCESTGLPKVKLSITSRIIHVPDEFVHQLDGWQVYKSGQEGDHEMTALIQIVKIRDFLNPG